MNMRTHVGSPESMTLLEVGPLTRDSVRPLVRRYLEHDFHSVLFMHWEIKPVEGHPENDKVVEEFLDVLQNMGIVA